MLKKFCYSLPSFYEAVPGFKQHMEAITEIVALHYKAEYALRTLMNYCSKSQKKQYKKIQ